MNQKSSNKKNVSMRIANAIHSDVSIFAKAHNLTFTQAVEQLLEEGLKSKSEPVAKKSDIERLIAETQKLEQSHETTRAALVQAIKNQPIAAMEQRSQPAKHKFLQFLRK